MIKYKTYFVYMVPSNSGTIYIGVTGDLIRRIPEHKEGRIKGFTQQYKCHRLIYYESYGLVGMALNREKELKKWSRLKKQNLIKEINPGWKDLFDKLF